LAPAGDQRLADAVGAGSGAFVETGPNAGGGLRWCVAASYADAALITDASLPGPDQNIMLIGMGFGIFVSTWPVTSR